MATKKKPRKVKKPAVKKKPFASTKSADGRFPI